MCCGGVCSVSRFGTAAHESRLMSCQERTAGAPCPAERLGRVHTTSRCFAVAQQTGARPGQGLGHRGDGTVPLYNGYALPGSHLFRNKAGDKVWTALTRPPAISNEKCGGPHFVAGAVTAHALTG